MKVKVIAEFETLRETIDRLVEETPKLFPDVCSVQMVDSGERYEVKRDKVWNYGEIVTIEESQFLEGMQVGEFFWFNIRPLILKYQPTDSDERILIVTHRNHVDLAKEIRYPLLKFVGMTPGGEISYAGQCDDKYGAVIVGVPNQPHENNTKVAAHEIAHLFLTPFTGNRGLKADHCENFQEGLRCLMNTPPDVTARTLEEIGLRFCNPCYQKLETAYKSLRQPVE
jgi:hypothetical protein